MNGITLLIGHLFIIAMLIAFFYARQRLNKLKAIELHRKECTLIIDHLYRADTLAEFEFWDNEARIFLDKSYETIEPKLINISAKYLGLAYKDRLEKGFEKNQI